MWLGGVARDVVGGVLWCGFFGVMGFTHLQPNLHIQSDCGKKDTISYYLGSMLV